MLAVAAAVVAAAVGFMWLGRAQAQPYILGLLALLAMVGLFALFAFAAGMSALPIAVLTIRSPAASATSSPEGIVAVDGAATWSIEPRLPGADRRRAAEEARPVERVFVGNPEVSEVVFRLLKASREGKRQQEEVRVIAPRRRLGTLAADARSADESRARHRTWPSGRSLTSRATANGRKACSRICSRDRISRPCADRLLLGQSVGNGSLRQRHAGELARL